MKTSVWVILLVLLGMLGFIIGYSLAPTDVDVVRHGAAVGGQAAESGGYGKPAAGGYGKPAAGGYGKPPAVIKGAPDEALAQKLNNILSNGAYEGHWQVRADEVYQWIQAKQNDFLIVDVRPNPAEYTEGHIPGSIAIPYYDILKPENLRKLPQDKKIILVCVTGQTQNLPIVLLRLLGYDAMTMSFGHAAWIKGYWAGDVMQGAIDGAAAENYPVEK